MTSRRRFLALGLTLLTLPGAAAGQDFFRAVSPDLRTSPDGWGPTRAGRGTPVGPALDPAGYATVGDGCPPPAAAPCDAGGIEAAFAAGSTSVQYLFGGYASTSLVGPDVPSFEYLMGSVRCGWMLTSPEETWTGRTNYEWLVDLSAAAVSSGGYGDYFAGPTFYLRQNWVEPGSPLVPYVQVGFGIVYTDAYRDRTQAAIGQQYEFYSRAEAGVKCFVAPNLSVDVEGGFGHISNAGHARRNLGVNVFGAQVGVTYYFPAGR